MPKLKITDHLSLDENDVEFSAIRAQGSGGQKVNKVSAAVHLRFDIAASSLPEFYKEKLLALKDKSISKEGIIVIKSQQYRSLEQNREEALERLIELIKSVTRTQKRRIPTRPTKGSVKRRIEAKKRLGGKKRLRGRVREES
ncbi:alternative ribosome rescue aminoacyl-tRNA hydrolase ArfB [Nitratifractor salsuginis]|uniref:Class I peptide chain release factor n=1 Tax=Nitratifractor salsuginis (strain DSM 16511 / JCM 12458 / E9I37-1) TaxID=749222 RepID=E6WY06_NITSE|nr:alternative ribosome rescue aminoacyl-tRNA hydrolase ArfB [Nitratifractor salsuginis]ADV46380.1 Class I peptide chain release factor [Nitratifractor salsuginis DSM 16511]